MTENELESSDSDAGMVTVETAMALIVMTLFFFMLCIMLILCITKIKAIDLSREIARLEARGENFNQQDRYSGLYTDRYTTVQVHHDNNLLKVDVTIAVPLAHISVHAMSYVAEENAIRPGEHAP